MTSVGAEASVLCNAVAWADSQVGARGGLTSGCWWFDHVILPCVALRCVAIAPPVTRHPTMSPVQAALASPSFPLLVFILPFLHCLCSSRLKSC